MHRIAASFIMIGLAVAVSAGSSAVTASNAGGVIKVGPISDSSVDSGTCGGWAVDVYDLFYTVRQNPDGTYHVREEFKHGTFETIEGATSPGGRDAPYGCTITLPGGITGKFQGSVDYTVTGTLNPDADCGPEGINCLRSDNRAFFGEFFPGGTRTTDAFLFNYPAGSNGHWKNASENRGGNNGDITG